MPNVITKIINFLLVLLIPILVVLGSARLLATDTYLALEYGKTSFPPDVYGFTSQQRFELASVNVHYVRAHLPDDALATQKLDATLIYSPRELSHMADVQSVFQVIVSVWQVAFVLLLFLGLILWATGEHRQLAAAVQSGGLFTSAMILTIALLAIFAWQSWFSIFHLFFFQPGSWLFSYSDTLIRLFPVNFWFDATLTISVLSLMGGLSLAWMGRQWRRSFQKSPYIIKL
ncbi:MAG TPA: TIGR01906 family membrane protein [Anaerolineales bacterium]|nr:TIGR01906 family membrane protein [Anaerolineales bacterium]